MNNYMHIKELENAIKDDLKWEKVSSIDVDEFPFKNYEEVKEKFYSKYSFGIDYTVANKLAQWLYGKGHTFLFLLLASIQFLVPIASIIMAIVLSNYWLLLGVFFGPVGFFVANPYNPFRKFFNAVVFCLCLFLIYLVLEGGETLIVLIVFYILPFFVSKYIYHSNQKKLEKVALQSELIFIFLYQNKALGFRNNETGKNHFYRG